MVESGELESEYSKLFFFLPSITNRAEEINKYMNNVSFSLIDITEEDFQQWLPDHNFEPHYLDLYGENQKINVAMRYESFEAYSSNLKRCFVRNAEGLFFRHEKEVPVDWIGNSKICVPSVKYFFRFRIGKRFS